MLKAVKGDKSQSNGSPMTKSEVNCELADEATYNTSHKGVSNELGASQPTVSGTGQGDSFQATSLDVSNIRSSTNTVNQTLNPQHFVDEPSDDELWD